VEENFLALLLEDPTGNRFIICSIYGPNSYNPQFFNLLRTDIRQLGNYPVVIGGDCNCTPSTDPINVNINCFNMIDVPNARQSQLVAELCDELNLADPFRFLHPNKSEFSYVAKNAARPTRSRIDFFLISRTILTEVFYCEIDMTRLTKAFDHNVIYLDFKDRRTKKPTATLRIKPRILRDPDIDTVCKSAKLN